MLPTQDALNGGKARQFYLYSTIHTLGNSKYNSKSFRVNSKESRVKLLEIGLIHKKINIYYMDIYFFLLSQCRFFSRKCMNLNVVGLV